MTTATKNPLFGPGKNPNLNACVGNNGGPYDFSSYADGFFFAAFYNIENAAEGRWTIDLLIYPICFNLRHGLELYIKHLIVLGARFLGEDSEAFQPTHKLTDNWMKWKAIVARLPKHSIEPTTLRVAQAAIDNFVAIDPTGQAFRYPEDLAKRVHLIGVPVINIETLYDEMKKLQDIFETWDSALIELLEYSEKSTQSVIH